MFRPTLPLETERLTLRLFDDADAADELVYAILADEGAASYMPRSTPSTANASSVGS